MCPNETENTSPLSPGFPWDRVRETLHLLLPGMPWLPGDGFPSASYLIGYAQAEEIPHCLTIIREIGGVPVPPGTSEAFVDGTTTREMLTLLFTEAELLALRGGVVVMDDCGEPHFIEARDLAAFLDWHDENAGFPFQHDLVLLFAEGRRISAFHHGGAVLHIFPGENVSSVAERGQTVVS